MSPNMNDIRSEVMRLIQTMHTSGEIDFTTYKFLLQSKEKRDTAHLYILPKTHKLTPKQLREAEQNGLNGLRIPGRPIISQVATPTYYIGHLIDFFLLPFVEKLPTYLKDTPAFIRLIEETEFPEDIKMCVYDVSNMYTVLNQDALLRATSDALPETLQLPPPPPSPQPSIKRNRIVELLALMLKKTTSSRSTDKITNKSSAVQWVRSHPPHAVTC